MAELETIPEEEYDEDGEERGEVLDVSHKVNEDVTLYQTELCVMYNCLHWERHSHYTGWNNVEIKQIVGHAMLRLNYDEYDGLNLEDVIERLRNEKDVLTELVKVPAEKLKKNWVNWIPKLHEKYVNMCRNDKKSVPSLCFVMVIH